MSLEKRITVGGGEIRRYRFCALRRKVLRWGALVGLVVRVGWSMATMKHQMRVRQVHLDISRISHAARLFRADFQRCPATIDELVHPSEGLSYLQEVIDPWGNPYRMVCPSLHDETDVQVISNGPDGDPLGRDNFSTLNFSEPP